MYVCTSIGQSLIGSWKQFRGRSAAVSENKFSQTRYIGHEFSSLSRDREKYKEERAERGYDISSANFPRPIAVAITIIAASAGLISRRNPVQSLFYPI